jgi:hypothetical protein
MPCYDPGPSHEQLEFDRRVRRGAVVALCKVAAILDAKGELPDFLAPWYAVHRATDDNRKWHESASMERNIALANARARGFDLKQEHPANQRYQATYNELYRSEAREREELAKLSD